MIKEKTYDKILHLKKRQNVELHVIWSQYVKHTLKMYCYKMLQNAN